MPPPRPGDDRLDAGDLGAGEVDAEDWGEIGGGQDGCAWACGGDAAVAGEDCRVCGVTCGEGEVVQDDADGGARAGEVGEDAEGEECEVRVHGADGFIGKEDGLCRGGAVELGERAGEAGALLLPRGEFVDRGICQVGELAALQRSADGVGVAPACVPAEGGELAYGHRGGDIGLLCEVGQVLGAGVGWDLGDGLAEEGGLAGGWAEDPGQEAYECAFSRAVWPDDSQKLAWGELEAHAAKDGRSAWVGEVDVVG